MKDIIIKSYEEELGNELYILHVPNNVNSESLKSALDMASKYASATEVYSQEDADYYELDNNWKKAWYDGNGIERFFNYLKVVYGWNYDNLNYDYEFEW